MRRGLKRDDARSTRMELSRSLFPDEEGTETMNFPSCGDDELAKSQFVPR